MWWILQNIARFLYYSILDFVFFIIVDAFAKFTIGDTNSKSMQEKRQIWFWESVVLIVLSIIIYLCDHFPFLLILLSLVTLGYTQFGVSFNLFRWWTQMKARWEEHQQHQDSMSRLQVQLDMQRKQQQQHGNPAFHHGMAFNQYPQQQIPKQNIFNATPVNKPKTNNQSERGMYMSGWAKTTQQRFSNMMKRFQGEKNEEKKGTSDSPPLKKTEFSFMPSLQAKSSFAGGQHFATAKDDSPSAKPSWYGDSLSRKPLRSGRSMPYSLATNPDNSFRSKIMSKFGFGSAGLAPLGLRNEGQNLCFINAVVQCLARTPGLVSELENEASCKDWDCSMAESLLLSTLSELIQGCNVRPSGGKPVLDPMAFRQAASSLNPNLVAPPTQRQLQQDAAEFFMWLVEILHSIINKNRRSRSNEKSASREPNRLKVMKFIYGDLTPAKVSDLKQACKQEIDAAHGLMNDSYAESVQRLSDLEWMSYKQENTSVVDNLFTGQLVIAYHCLADNHISVNMQTFRLLPVPIEAPREVNGLVHLSDCFTKFCNIEHLVGQDGLECSFCNAQRARQQEPPQTPLTTPYLRKHYNLRTPSVNGRTLLSSADSAVSGVGSPLATNFMSPIPGSRDMLSDSGFQDNVFKTSTPISDNQIPFPQRLRDAQRRCSLRQLPDCFVIQLMRFSYNPYTRQTNKVHSPVSIPLSNLDLTEVMFDTITNREDLAEEDAVYKYDLYGLCCHLGGDSANYGHYISYCLHGDNKWYRFDDERVIEVDMEYELTTHEIRQNAYLLFYKKQGMSV